MIAKLAFKDLVHEWLLSLCLVLAIAAILAPLMVLFGLKTGTIETMRGRLVMDPKNREIRPMTSASFDRPWFQTMAADPRVAFVVPMTRQISSSVEVRAPGGEERMTILSTQAGDPLLLENSAPVPGERGCVLTAAAAEAVGVKAGDQVELETRRLRGGSYEGESLTVTVEGVLDERAGGVKAVYVQLAVLEAVEDYKDGRAVARYGWAGAAPLAYPVYDGVVVFVPAALDKLSQLMLANNTGFREVKEVTAGELFENAGLRPRAGYFAYLVTSGKKAVDEESVAAVRGRLRGKAALLVPWVRPLEVRLAGGEGDGQTLRLAGFSAEAAAALEEPAAWPAEAGPLYLRVPENLATAVGERELVFTHEDRELRVPVRVESGGAVDGPALTSAQLAGLLNLLKSRDVEYDRDSGEFLLSRRGYSGFRLYAASIDLVAELEAFFHAKGLPVHTERERIAEVVRLDRYLGLIFWLIALIGVVGGMAALTASLYASVERKKKELNTLRLLGLSRLELVRFPIAQGMGLAGGGFVTAAGLFSVVALTINTLFRSHLRGTESLCRLLPAHFLAIGGGVLVLSILAAGLAAFRATTMDPAEALRDE